DLAGLRPDEVDAVRQIEKVGGKVRRAPDGTVTEVTLTDKAVKDHHAAVKCLSAFRHLRKLDLSYLKLTDEGMRHVEPLTDLTDLDLSGNYKLGDAGLKRLKKLSNLRELRLWTTEVTDAGLDELRGLDRLEVLHLAQTSVTDAGVGKLAGIGRLRK